jgi:transposase
MEDAGGRSRRRHSGEVKRVVLAECAKPGASVARVALAHGLNANLVHKWRRLAGRECGAAVATRGEVFVPVAVAPATPTVAADIRIELRRGAVAINVAWPVGAAAECARWMRELLR